MNCHYHPDRQVERECRICHELICSECMVPVGHDAVCKHCLSENLSLQDLGAAPIAGDPHDKSGSSQPQAADSKAVAVLKTKTQTLRANQKSGFLTVLFSCLPGLGHMYLGLQQRGLNLMIIFFSIIFLQTLAPGNMAVPIALAIPVLWFYSQFDALKYRTLINNGEWFEDVPILPQLRNLLKLSWLGYLLAALGVFGIFNQVLDYLVMDWGLHVAIRNIVSAVILIAVGFWIIRGKAGQFFSSARERDDREHA